MARSIAGVRAARRSLAVLVALFLGAMALSARPVEAQEPGASPWDPAAIVAIDQPRDASVVDLDAIGLVVGQPATRHRLREAARALIASGRWADVQIDAMVVDGGVRLTLHLVPRVVLTRIDVVGSARLDRTSLLDLLALDQESELDGEPREALRELTERVENRYRELGHPRAVVTLGLRDTDEPSRKVLRVEVDEGEPLRLRSLVAEGCPRTDRLDPVSVFPLTHGDVLDVARTTEAAREAERRLRELGYLEAAVGEVRIDGEGDVRVPCRLGRHLRVEIQGFDPLTRPDVEQVLDVAGARSSRSVRDAAAERIADLYRRHGFLHARAAIRLYDDPTSDEPRDALLRVEIEHGPRVRVVGLSFPGAAHFQGSFLREQVRSYLEEELPSSQPFEPVDSDVVDRIGFSGRTSQAARTVPAHLEAIPSTVWYEPLYVEAANHLREVYQSAGYLEARVGTPSVRELEGEVLLDPAVDAVPAVVTISVFEGPRTLLHDVRVHGNEVIDARVLLAAANLERGSPLSELATEAARRRIVDLYQDRGYFFARVEARTSASGDRSRADVVFEIIEGSTVRVGEIRIAGNTRTDEGIVREQLRFAPGDLYRPILVRQSEEALLRIGVFGSVHITPADPDLEETEKAIVVTLSEQRPQVFDLGGGVGTGDGVRGSLEYTYRNLFGLGISSTLSLQLAYQFFFQDEELERAITQLGLLDRLERRLTLQFLVPAIPGVDDVRVALDLVHLRDNFRDFGLDKNGVVLTLTYQPDRRAQLSVSGELEQNGVTLFGDTQDLQEYLASPGIRDDPRIQRLLRVPAGQSALASVRLTGAYDARDNPFTPTSGVYLGGALEYARTLSTERPDDFSNMLKASATVSGYLDLYEGLTLAVQYRVGRVFHLERGSRTYPNRAFFLGGVDTLRGYLQDQVIPQDQLEQLEADPTLSAASITRTGDFFHLLRVEFRIPLYGAFQLGVFSDVGNVWALADSASLSDIFTRVRVTAGLGLRITTPVGPVVLDYGLNLTRVELFERDPGAFHFSIGLF